MIDWNALTPNVSRIRLNENWNNRIAIFVLFPSPEEFEGKGEDDGLTYWFPREDAVEVLEPEGGP